MGENSRGSSNGREFDPIDDAVVSALESRHCRCAPYVLAVQESIPATELANVVSDWIHVDDHGEASREGCDDVYLPLTHRHFPALEVAGTRHL